ncbi:MAG: extracellular solute-binding protein [Faecalibacterium sp.]|jgi:raffinose/stachyose/melibiose transport system substrate-binding protein|nr:extracellular solute-binding protein [Faecalibacterium sp.]
MKKRMISRRDFLKASAVAAAAGALTACGSNSTAASASGSAGASSAAAQPVTLNVVTSYGGDDGNRTNYENAYKAYEDATGNTVLDASETSNEEWKAKVNTDFETGSEPDVLFYFTGSDSAKIVESGKVVALDDIRAEYPDYASNMKDELLSPSPADGKVYAIPVNGYWEALYCNTKVLADCGLTAPTADTTWDAFMEMCKTIAGKGYTPVACSLQEVPHYWFEYTVFNHGSVANHDDLPASSEDEVGKKWADGLGDIKAMYEAKCFPENTLTAGDADTFQLMTDDKAAFAIDGSWKIGYFQENAMDLANFTVTYVPGQGDRKSTDMIGGLSMGYYITKKAWDDPAKRDAAVKFVEMMTTDDVVSAFGATAITALKNGTTAPADADNLMTDALTMTKGATGIAAATEDGLSTEARSALFADVKNVVTGNTTAAEAIDNCLATES